MEIPLIVLAVLGFVAFLIWNRSKGNLERRRLELDAQDKMLERIGPGEALTAFLRTEEGKQFFDRLTATQAEAAGSRDPRKGVLTLTVLGLIALCGGFFIVNAVAIPNLLVSDPEIPFDILPIVLMPAVLLTGGGFGALIAAWFLHRLSKRWGMAEDAGGETRVG